MKNSFIKYILFFAFSFILVFIDQWTKNIAKIRLENNKPFVLINDILEFVYVENEGAAFGILQKKQTLFFGLTIFVLVAILYFVYKLNFTKHNIFYFIFYILIFSGAVGNFIDRVKNKYVVDFIYFKPINFPVFNFADICITVGCVVMIISMLTIYKNDNL